MFYVVENNQWALEKKKVHSFVVFSDVCVCETEMETETETDRYLVGWLIILLRFSVSFFLKFY